jgi:hypothetical protein
MNKANVTCSIFRQLGDMRVVNRSIIDGEFMELSLSVTCSKLFYSPFDKTSTK